MKTAISTRVPQPVQKLDVSVRVIRQLLEAAFYEELIPYRLVHNRLEAQVDEQPCHFTGHIGAFGRVRLKPASVQKWLTEADFSRRLAQIMLTLTGEPVAKRRVHEALIKTRELSQWNSENLLRYPRRALHYEGLESTIIEGHLYHPCYKSRTGFTEQDHRLYSPECRNSFELEWIAIQRRWIAETPHSPSLLAYWQTMIGLTHTLELLSRFEQKGLNESEYRLIPLHPWQWHHLESELASAIEHKWIVPLGKGGGRYQASASLRTLISAEDAKRPHIKLPINIEITSSKRVIPAHTLRVAPVISEWLSKLIENDRFFTFESPFMALNEFAAERLKTSQECPEAVWLEGLAEQICFIARQSPQAATAKAYPNHRLIPMTALSLIEHDGKPFIDPWIQQFGVHPWAQQLIKTVVWPVWHLLVHHGIGIEAHGQNSILGVSYGWPELLIARDFHESLEYVESFINEPSLIPDWAHSEPMLKDGPLDEYYWMSSVDGLRELFTDTLFVFNLTEISSLLEQHYQYPEPLFWGGVHDALKEYQARGFTPSERLAQIDLLSDHFSAESLLTQKLLPQSGPHSHTVPNALSEATSSPLSIPQVIS